MTVKEMRDWLKGKNNKAVIYITTDITEKELDFNSLTIKTNLNDLKKYK